MKNAIIYTRVSTDEQALRGYSLQHQKEVLTVYCQIKKINIVKHFQDDYSAKNFNRPEFNKLKSYVLQNKQHIDLLLFTRWDRFSRNIQESYSMIKWFSDNGIELNASEQPLNLEISENKLMLAIFLAQPEIENDKISERTKEGIRKAQKLGCYTSKAPFGYDNVRNEQNHATLEPNKDANIVVRAFKEYAKGVYTMEEVRHNLIPLGLKMNKQCFNRLLKRIVYTGKIRIAAWRKEPEIVVNGLHQPLISEELFYKTQDIINGRKRNYKESPNTNHHLFLRGHLICQQCGCNLTGSGSRGHGGIYYYYHCQNGCNERFRADLAEKIFMNYLSELTIDKEISELYITVLKDVYKQKNRDEGFRIKQLGKDINKYNTLLENAEDKYFNNKIDHLTFIKAKERYQEKITRLTVEKNSAREYLANIDKYLEFGFTLLQNLSFYFDQSSPEVKQKLLDAVFPEKLIFSNQEYRTSSDNPLVSLIVNNINILHSNKKRPGINFDIRSHLAPEEGLEPPT